MKSILTCLMFLMYMCGGNLAEKVGTKKNNSFKNKLVKSAETVEITNAYTSNKLKIARSTAAEILGHLSRQNYTYLSTHHLSKAGERLLTLKKIREHRMFNQWLGNSYRKGYQLQIKEEQHKLNAIASFNGEAAKLNIQLIQENKQWKILDIGFWK